MSFGAKSSLICVKKMVTGEFHRKANSSKAYKCPVPAGFMYV